jgi:hypothetical protein
VIARNKLRKWLSKKRERLSFGLCVFERKISIGILWLRRSDSRRSGAFKRTFCLCVCFCTNKQAKIMKGKERLSIDVEASRPEVTDGFLENVKKLRSERNERENE